MDSQHQVSYPESPTQPRKVTAHNGIGRLGWIILGTIALGSLLAIGILPRLSRQAELKAAAKVVENTLPTVNVMHPKRAEGTTSLQLPGSVVALNETTVYARTTGYLQRWLVDIGDRVQAGQVLAVIESPEVDQQVAQAQADLAQAEAVLVQRQADLAKGNSDLKQAIANKELARQTWERWQTLVKQGVVTQQDADTKEATYKANLATVESAQNTVNSAKANISAAQASVGSSRANLHRYQVLQSFEKVTAPFSGVITARNIGAGALVISNSTNNNTSLYKITDYDTLDVNVNVPQTLAQSIQLNQSVQVTVKELPQKVFVGKVIRTSNAIDPSSRTLLTQLLVQNSENALRPGMYATTNFSLSRDNPPLMVPGSAIVTNAGGTQVAVIGQGQTIHYQKVGLGRDYGTQVEITSGLGGNELLVTNPTVDLNEGTRVKATAAPQEKGAGK